MQSSMSSTLNNLRLKKNLCDEVAMEKFFIGLELLEVFLKIKSSYIMM